LELFKKYTEKDVYIEPIDGKSVDKSFIDTRRLINYDIPSYELMIEGMVKNMKSNFNLYPYKK